MKMNSSSLRKILFALLAALVAMSALACAGPDKEGPTEAIMTTSPVLQQAAVPTLEPAPSTAPASDSTNTIVANAQGEINITPDVAYVSVGMSTNGSSAEKVQKDNDEAMTAILKAIKDVGVADSDISTSEYSVYPEYDYSSSRQIIKGYTAVNRAMVTINDINNVGKVLEAANSAGANEIGNISFSVRDMNGAYDLALAEAIRAARTRAQVMADASGVSLGGLVNVSETGYYVPQIQRSYKQYAASSMESADMSAGAGVSSGELKVTANATVVFEIK